MLWTADSLTAASPDLTYSLPGPAASVAASADGKVIWIVCYIARPGSPPNSLGPFDSVVYTFDPSNRRLTEILKAAGVATVTVAPMGSKAIIVLPDEHSNGKALLYDGSDQNAGLPLDFSFLNPIFVLWNSDGRRLYSYGGSTIQADAWNILAMTSIDSRTVSKRRLAIPTESAYVCSRTGHVFVGLPGLDRTGHLERTRAAEYDADLNLIGRSRFSAGGFSATCRYVATPSSFHGPIPWRITETASGREVSCFDFTGGETGKEEFEFESWNPKRDEILLRTRYNAAGAGTDLQVFELSHKAVIETFRNFRGANFDGQAAWSADGLSLLLARGRSLRIHPLALPAAAKTSH